MLYLVISGGPEAVETSTLARKVLEVVKPPVPLLVAQMRSSVSNTSFAAVTVTSTSPSGPSADLTNEHTEVPC